MAGSKRLERFFLAGPVGRLDALLESEPKVRPAAAAIVCHPHPIYGGTMHNKVVYSVAKAAVQVGLPVLRFNFRGAGRSEGEFADGFGERQDVRAALDFLTSRFPETPICMMGFSFGAWVGMAAGAEDPRVCALVGLGIPVGSADLGFLRAVTKPKLIVQGKEDQFVPSEPVEILFRSFAEPKRLHWVRGADHFFTGKLTEVQEAVREFLQEIVAGISPKAE